ncbi:MAG: hypothetical protein J5802_14660 [Butyrivibrio sp.]|nr:hypothetical protein [Butyrivibrio sp.]
MKKRQTIARLILILVTVLSLWYLDGMLCVKSEHGIDQSRALYYQPRNSIDVAMLGSSHVHCDIDTSLLWHEYGIAAYDYSAAEQPLWTTYYYLKELCKYQKPQAVVLDLYSTSINRDDYQYTWLLQNLYGVRFSLNKLQMLFASAEPSKISEYFPSFVYYHNRLGQLSEEDYLYPLTAPKTLREFKGYTPNIKKEPQAMTDPNLQSIGELSPKSELYLNKIIEYTKKHDIKLLLIVAPYITNDEYENFYDRIKDIADQNGVQFCNANDLYDEIGLDFKTDFNDASHLNYWGACKFTSYLGKDLKKRYNLPDRRGERRYDSWASNYQKITEYMKDK